MRKKELLKDDPVKIGELAKMTGVSTPAIHFYLREGLLTPPVRKSRNMAYYDPKCAEEIKLIKELQSKRYLPLSAIKMILQARREGQEIGHIGEMRSFMEELFHPLRSESKTFSSHELERASGLSSRIIKDLEAKGLLTPRETGKGLKFDDIDLRIAEIFKKFQEYGFTTADMEVYRQYIEAIRNEAKAVHTRIHQIPDMEKMPLAEIFRMFNEIKDYLTLRIYREEVMKPHASDNVEEEKG